MEESGGRSPDECKIRVQTQHRKGSSGGFGRGCEWGPWSETVGRHFKLPVYTRTTDKPAEAAASAKYATKIKAEGIFFLGGKFQATRIKRVFLNDWNSAERLELIRNCIMRRRGVECGEPLMDFSPTFKGPI